jgi:hypothetical protein
MAADRSGARRRAVGRPSESNWSHTHLLEKNRVTDKAGKTGVARWRRRLTAAAMLARLLLACAMLYTTQSRVTPAPRSSPRSWRFAPFWPSPTRAKIEEHGCLQLLGTDEWKNASKLSQRGILLNFCVEWCGPPLRARPVPHHLQRVLSVSFFCAAGMANARPFNRWAAPRRARTSRQP